MLLPLKKDFMQMLQPATPSALLALTDGCSICMNTEDTDVLTLNCDGRHSFCRGCVSTWFQDSTSCPLCRQVLYCKVEKKDKALIAVLKRDMLAGKTPNTICPVLVHHATTTYELFQRSWAHSVEKCRQNLDGLLTIGAENMGMAAFVFAFAIFTDIDWDFPDTTRTQWAAITSKVFQALCRLHGQTMSGAVLWGMLWLEADEIMSSFENRETYYYVIVGMIDFVLYYALVDCRAEEGAKADLELAKLARYWKWIHEDKADSTELDGPLI